LLIQNKLQNSISVHFESSPNLVRFSIYMKSADIRFSVRVFPHFVILKNDRKKYYDVLGKADSGKYEPLVKFIAQSIERSLDIYLKTLTPANQKQEKFLTLKKISKNTTFSAKYLNLLARQGKLEAYKEDRDWLTSKEAVERYLKNRTRKRKTIK